MSLLQYLQISTALSVGSAVSLLLSALLVLTHRWHIMLTADETNGVQKVHRGMIPRVGGLAIILGFAAATPLMGPVNSPLLWLLLVAVLPAWLFGILEDITHNISTRLRLIATMFSALMAWWLTGYGLYRVDVIGLDSLLGFTPIAVLLTMVAVAGVAHSINLIDGFNGLASGTVLICFGALAWIAFDLQDGPLFDLTLVAMAVTVGFFVMNYPFGKIFLGDSGAYTLGFFLAWISVMLVNRHDADVSPWAPFLICAYPILETLFSMWRRVQHNRRMDHPDRVHLHSLVFRRIMPRFFPNASLSARNALATPFLWLFALAPAIAGVYWRDNTLACIAALVVTALLYIALHRRLTRFKWFA
jgi:UDP-N-acetylmuramyl pentapeptide phosphotransferase/UDP-N-acetylglucosamine-1-phosphate transferase